VPGSTAVASSCVELSAVPAVIEAGAAHEIVGVTVCGVDTPPPDPEEQPIKEIPDVRASALSRLIEYKVPPQNLQKVSGSPADRVGGEPGELCLAGARNVQAREKLNRFTVRTCTGRNQPLSRRISGAAANSRKIPEDSTPPQASKSWDIRIPTKA
jgi:hypothetical protein